jgi:hypothetical protein
VLTTSTKTESRQNCLKCDRDMSIERAPNHLLELQLLI